MRYWTPSPIYFDPTDTLPLLNRSRTDIFVRRLMELKARAPEKIELVEPAMATEEEITLFHTKVYDWNPCLGGDRDWEAARYQKRFSR